MKVLGIDPGSLKTGFGVIETISNSSKITLIDYGTFWLNKEPVLHRRLALLYIKILEIIQTYQPQKAIIENVFVGKNVKSALLLGQARGVVLSALGSLNIEVYHTSPLAVKMAITGFGKASKHQMQKMVQTILELPKVPQQDAADALALAISAARDSQYFPEQKHKLQSKNKLYQLALMQGKI